MRRGEDGGGRRRALWGGKGGRNCKEERGNPYLKRVYTSSFPGVSWWISLLDVLVIIQLSEIRLFSLHKRLRASDF